MAEILIASVIISRQGIATALAPLPPLILLPEEDGAEEEEEMVAMCEYKKDVASARGR